MGISFNKIAKQSGLRVLPPAAVAAQYPPAGELVSNPLFLSHFDNDLTNEGSLGGTAVFRDAASFSTNSQFGSHAVEFIGAGGVGQNGSKNDVDTGINLNTLGQSDFTVAFNFLLTASSIERVALGNKILEADQTSFVILQQSLSLSFWNGGTFVSTPGIIVGQYQHYAVVREGNTIRTFIDGIKIAEADASSIDLTSTNNFVIGNAGPDGSTANWGEWLGQIDEVLVVKEALYTADFTIPTEPYSVA